MKKLITTTSVFLLFILLNSAFGQSNVNVSIAGFSFSPANITINEGDTVTWTNSSGTPHNIQGSQSIFPSNPESFGNSISGSFVYFHVFNITGSYDYRCDVHFGGGMTGTVTVNPSTGISHSDKSSESLFKAVYPIPASETLTIEFDESLESSAAQLQVIAYDSKGSMLHTADITNRGNLTLDVTTWAEGSYFIQVASNKSVLGQTEVLISRQR